MNAEWSAYFQTLSGVSATMLGIAFVAFQFKHDSWAKDKLRHPVAVLSLVELASPVFFSLMLLFPAPLWSEWGWFVDAPAFVVAGVLIGLGGYLVIGWHVWAYLHDTRRQLFDHWQLGGNLIPLVTFGAMLFAPGLEWKAAMTMWMVLSGSIEAWLYMRTPARP